MNETGVFPIGDVAYDAVYAREAAMVDASELIARALESSGISRAELARKLGVSRSEITARLKGERNITVRTLAETLHALGERLTLAAETRAVKRRAVSEWRMVVRRAEPRQVSVGAWQREDTAHGR